MQTVNLVRKEEAQNVFTIDNFWSKQQCEDFIAKNERLGFFAAKIQTHAGLRVVESVRNNESRNYIDFDLANNLWEQVKHYVVPRIGGLEAIGLNEFFRIYKYQPGQVFNRHRDMSYVRNEKEASYYTFMIYLNDNFEGGNTTFDNATINPR